MNIPLYNFKDILTDDMKSELRERFNHIMENTAFIEGDYNFKFEEEFAKRNQAKHCLLVANGTDALEISLKVLGVEVGDKVAVPNITFYATAESVLNRGAIPIFVDVDPKTGLMCVESLERLYQKHQFKVVIPVHIYGMPAPMKAINQFCHQNGVKVIEDAAQACGASIYGEALGAGPNLVTFSFYPTKNLGAFGDAGCILTNDDEMARLIKIERNHGRGDENKMGRNSRCDHIQAAALHTKLKNIDELNGQRKKIAARYLEELSQLDLELMPKEMIEFSSWHLYPVLLKNKELRDGLKNYLAEKGIGHAPFYERTLSAEPPLSKYEGEDRNAQIFSERVLCLPISPFLKDEEIKTIKEAIGQYLSQNA